MRHIPVTMATQHPDNASTPYWEKDGDGFVSAKEEVMEAASAFADLGVDEFMWDWEGKYVDEAVVERLFTEYHNYFKRRRLGRDIFLTFRIPNIWQEKGYSLARAFMAILTAADMAHDFKFGQRPLFEVILPMTQSAGQLLHIQKTFSELAKVKHRLFADQTRQFNYIEIIPLIESVENMFSVNRLLDQYRVLHQKYYHRSFPYLRPFLARSDPALISGIVAAVLGNKVALSSMYQWGKSRRVGIYPIVGVGSLPFRGGCSPVSIKYFTQEYRGVRTVTIQSAFRYDYPLAQVKTALRTLQRVLPQQRPPVYSEAAQQHARQIAALGQQHYRAAITAIAPEMFRLSAMIPPRRERRLHIGLLGYSRTIGRKEFPRAITFTAALYSLGVPPELIGTGRTLQALSLADRKVLHQLYCHLEHDLISAGYYLNKENLAHLAKKHLGWRGVQKDIEFIEKYFGISLGPKTNAHYLHRNSTSTIYLLSRKKQAAKTAAAQTTILTAAKLRRSLG